MGGQYAITTAGGSAVGTPDTCKVPTGTGADVPTPFTNTGQCSAATSTSTNVLVTNMPVCLASSIISASSGDESGTSGGVTSGMIMGQVSFKSYSSKVKIKGQGVVYLTCATAQNGSSANCVGSVSSPSQTKVTVGP